MNRSVNGSVSGLLRETATVAVLVSLFTVVAMLAAPESYAETVYVSDYLRVGVRPAPDTSEAPVNVVTTGMALEVLQRKNGFLRIRTDGDVEGWIKEIYVVSEMPAGQRLQTLEKEHDELKAQFAQLQQQAAEAAQTNRSLADETQRLRQDNVDLQLQVVQLQNANKPRLAETSSFWLLVSGVFAVLAAFGLGVAVQRFIMRRRFGGLKL
jgi:SH3 domain protein